ncbi:MAG TPA: hypothetical protein VF581_04315 [Flavobacterium sp.]|jgi:hypothetical protein
MNEEFKNESKDQDWTSKKPHSDEQPLLTRDESPLPEPATYSQPEIEEEADSKPGIWTLLIGILLVGRGVMRYNQEGMGGFAIVMILVGVASIGYFVVKRI